MEDFNVTKKINPLTQPVKDIKDMAKEKFSKGVPDFRMTLKLLRGLIHIDEVIDEIEATTNLIVSRSKIGGLGLDHKDSEFAYWTIRVWSEEKPQKSQEEIDAEVKHYDSRIDVEQLLKDLSYEHNSDLQKMFEAVLNAKLNPLDFVLGEAMELNKLKKLINKNKED